MKGRLFLLSMLTLALLLVLVGSTAANQPAQSPDEQGKTALTVPTLLSYQGRLTDPATSAPVPDGTYAVSFAIYDAASGGTLLWSESYTGADEVPVTGGLFTVLLGSKTPLSAALFDGAERWLQVEVEGEGLAGRQRIVSVAYALQAQNADTLDGSHASAFAAATHNHDARYVNTDGDRMTGSLGVPLLDVVNTGAGFGVSGYGQSNIGVYGASGTGSGLVGISGLVGVYGNGEDTGVVGAGRQIGVKGIGGATGTGVKGSGMTGVWGESSAGSGVRGQGGAYGVYGSSDSGMGVFGTTTSLAGLAPAVYGRHEGAGPGVQGQSTSGTGVLGTSTSGSGGVFTSTASIGAYVASAQSYGMKVQSDDDIGVYAHSGSWAHPIYYSGHYAVLGVAEEGTDVWGKGGVTGGLFVGGGEGVHATGDITGVTGIGDQVGVYGVASDYNAVGVEGRAGFGTGVKGWGETGVYGESSLGMGVQGRGPTGVSGVSTIGYGVSGTTDSANGAGVYAEGADENSPDLILGGTSSTNDNGLLSSAPWLAHSDLVFYSNDEFHIYLDHNGDGSGEFRIYNGTAGPTWNMVFRVNENGDTWALGTKGAAVPTQNYGTRTLYALESTEVWFEDFGLAQLQDGVAVVTIDHLFAETVNLAVGYHVFLTPVDGWAALYVVNKTPTSFEVRDANGKANIAFDYRLVAKRLGYENVRLEPAELGVPEE
jgi:hypothetical protein